MNNKIKCLFAFFIFIFASNTFAGNITTYKEAKAFEANLYRNYSCQGEAVDFCDDCSYEALRLRNYIDEENAILYLVRDCGICGLYIIQKVTPKIAKSCAKPYDMFKKGIILFKGRNPLLNGKRYY